MKIITDPEEESNNLLFSTTNPSAILFKTGTACYQPFNGTLLNSSEKRVGFIEPAVRNPVFTVQTPENIFSLTTPNLHAGINLHGISIGYFNGVENKIEAICNSALAVPSISPTYGHFTVGAGIGTSALTSNHISIGVGAENKIFSAGNYATVPSMRSDIFSCTEGLLNKTTLGCIETRKISSSIARLSIGDHLTSSYLSPKLHTASELIFNDGISNNGSAVYINTGLSGITNKEYSPVLHLTSPHKSCLGSEVSFLAERHSVSANNGLTLTNLFKDDLCATIKQSNALSYFDNISSPAYFENVVRDVVGNVSIHKRPSHIGFEYRKEHENITVNIFITIYGDVTGSHNHIGDKYLN